MENNNGCRKFEANMFNKVKCQNCFRAKEEHSSKALEHLRNARKVAKCAYLFVAPESFDFTNQMDRTRRWQRRFFVLYDDGELTYSVDDNIDTIPQGIIDMNSCSEVCSAEDATGHQFSISIVTPKSETYIKGSSREEISRWQDILSTFPGNLKGKNKKTFEKSLSQPVGVTERNVDNLRNLGCGITAPPATASAFRTSPALAHGDDSNYLQTVNVTASAGDTSTASLPSERPFPVGTGLSSAAAIDRPSSSFRGIRSLKHKNDRSLARSEGGFDAYLRKTSSLQDVTDSSVSAASDAADRIRSPAMAKTGDAVSLERPKSVHNVATLTNLDYKATDATYVKKGWLLQQAGDKDWVRRWCVLSARSLSVYEDTNDELADKPEFVLVLSSSTAVTDLDTSHQFTFRVTTESLRLVLAAASQGIRQLWKDAIIGCISRMSSEQIDELPTRLVNTSSDEASLRHVNYDTWSSGSSEAVHVSTSSLPLHASDGSKDSNRHSLQTKRLLRQTETADTFGSPQKTSGSEPAMETSRRPVDSSADGNRYFEAGDSSDNESSAATDITCDNTLVELLETEVASLKRQLEFSQSQLSEFQKVNTDLRRHLLSANIERQNDVPEDTIVGHMRYQLEDFENNSACIQDKYGRQELEKLQIQVKSLKRKLRQALKTMKSQKKEIESLQNQLTTSASKSRATLEAMLAQVSRETKEERDRLQLQISSLERHKSDYERRESELIAEVKRLEKKLEVALGRAQNLRVELDAKVANIQELLSERERLRQQLLEETDANQQQLNQSLQQLSLKDAENTALKRDYNALKDETSALRQELTRHGNLMLSLQGDAKQLADDRNRLAALLSENDVKNSAVALEKDRVDSQMGSMREENSKLKHSIKVHEQNLASLQLQVKSQDSELKQLKSELSKRNELLNNLRKSNDEKLPLVQNARSVGPKETAKSLEELRKENAALLGELNSCKASISKLQNDVEVCQKEHKQGSKFDQNVEDTSAKTQSQVDRQRKQLEAELLQFKQQCSELTSVVDSLKNNQLVLETSHDETVSRLQSHNAELLAKLASAERRCRSLEQQHKFDFDEAAGGSCRMDADHGNAVSQSILGLSLEPLSPSPSLSSESSLCSVSPEGETTDDNESLHGECDSKVPGSRLHAGVLELESHMDLLNRQLSGGFEQGCDELPKVVANRQGVSSQAAVDLRIADLEKRIQDMQTDYELELELQRAAHKRELARTREEMMQLLSSVESGRPIQENVVGQKYMKELEHIKEVFNRNFSAMEKSHQAALQEVRLEHQQELEKLQQEREAMLQAEAQDTQAALKAMKKAHEVELENERAKYRDLMSKMSANAGMESFHKKHDEIRELSEQYSMKCLESAALQKQLEDSQLQIKDLIARNDDLNKRLKTDVERLGKLELAEEKSGKSRRLASDV